MNTDIKFSTTSRIYSCLVNELDLQHLELINLSNKTIEALRESKGLCFKLRDKNAQKRESVLDTLLTKPTYTVHTLHMMQEFIPYTLKLIKVINDLENDNTGTVEEAFNEYMLRNKTLKFTPTKERQILNEPKQECCYKTAISPHKSPTLKHRKSVIHVALLFNIHPQDLRKRIREEDQS